MFIVNYIQFACKLILGIKHLYIYMTMKQKSNKPLKKEKKGEA